MPSSLLSLATSELKARHKEPFLTDAMNRRGTGVVSPGIYTGFDLATSASALSVTLTPDAANLNIAVFETSTAYQVAIRRQGSSTLDLSAYASKTVVIALYAEYAVGATTLGQVRAYELSPSDELTSAPEYANLVMLGTVAVPASGLIGAASITLNRRTSAGSTAPNEGSRWIQVLRNGGFEQQSAVSGAGGFRFQIPFWDVSNLAPTIANINRITAQVHEGVQSVALNILAVGTVSLDLYQALNIPVQAGQKVSLRGWYRNLLVPTAGANNIAAYIVWKNSVGGTLSTSRETLITATTNAAIDRFFELTMEAPAGACGISLAGVTNSGTYASTGSAMYFDDISLWVEPTAVTGTEHRDGRTQQLNGSALVLTPITDNLSTRDDVPVIYPSSSSTLVIERADGGTSGVTRMTVALREKLELGANMRAAASDWRQPRIKALYESSGSAIGTNITLMWEFAPEGGAAGGPTRLYMDDDGASIWTRNAAWTGSAWAADHASTASTAWIHKHFFQFWYMAAGTSPWGWLDWDENFQFSHTGRSLQIDDGLLRLGPYSSITNPATSATPLGNTLYGLNVPKAWGAISTGGSPSLLDGFNINTSVTYSGSTAIVAFRRVVAPPSAASYVVVATMETGGVCRIVGTANLGTGSFQLQVFDAAGTQINLSSTIETIRFVVYARQTT